MWAYGVDWDSLVESELQWVDPSDYYQQRTVDDVDGVEEWTLGDFTVLEASRKAGAEACVRALLNDCHGGLIGMDLEWRPVR